MLVHGIIFLLSPYVCVAEGCVYVSAWYYISTVAIRVCCRRMCVYVSACTAWYYISTVAIRVCCRRVCVCMLVHGIIFLQSPYVCVAEGCVCVC